MQTSPRRRFLTKIGKGFGFLWGGTAILAACQQVEKRQETYDGDSCDDLRRVSEAERTKRKSFGYVSKTPIADNQCSNCNLYLPPKEAQACGKCILFEGPVQSEGYCTYWALKA